MTEHTCQFGDYREELLLGYLYDDLDSPTRGEFESHLDACVVCRQELDGLRTVRRQLATWTPPTFGRDPRIESRVESPAAGSRSGWQTIPAWAQVAAALLFLGISAGLANLNIHYDRSGLTIRTGWSTPAAATAASAAAPVAPAAAGNQAPWKADLTALERQLRSEMQATVQPARASATDADTLRRVRALIADSEKAQQRELALRVAEVMRDVDTQRRADLTRISENLGQLRTNTGMEVLKQRQLLNYLVSVSQKQQ